VKRIDCTVWTRVKRESKGITIGIDEHEARKENIPIKEKIQFQKPNFTLSQMLVSRSKPEVERVESVIRMLIPTINYKNREQPIKVPKSTCTFIEDTKFKQHKKRSISLKEYIELRLQHLKELQKILRIKVKRIEEKELVIESLIPIGGLNVESELEKLKQEVIKVPAYRLLVAQYLFNIKKLGWTLPTSFIEFPYVSFEMTQFPVIVRLTINKDKISELEVKESISDIPIKNVELLLKDNNKEFTKLDCITHSQFNKYLSLCISNISLSLIHDKRNTVRILWRTANLLQELNEFFNILNLINNKYTITLTIRNAGVIEYNVTMSDRHRRILIAYKITSNISNLKKILSADPIFVKKLSNEDNIGIEKVQEEVEGILKEKISTTINTIREHYELTIFTNNFISSY